MAIIDGPRLPPAAGGAPRQLVVFLHGYGADGNDLIGLGREWAKQLPHAAFVSPHAPEPCAGAPMGRQWFNLTFRQAGELITGVRHAAPALEAFLDAELKRHGLGPRALGLVGFSQGTMMALGVGLKRRPAPAAIVGYSGALATVEALPNEPGSAPAILLVHGDSDEVIPVDAMFIAREQLAQAGLPVEWHVARGIGHGIDAEGLHLGGAFLKQAFAAAPLTQGS
jgi:phospholipase/carboxylesterase